MNKDIHDARSAIDDAGEMLADLLGEVCFIRDHANDITYELANLTRVLNVLEDAIDSIEDDMDD